MWCAKRIQREVRILTMGQMLPVYNKDKRYDFQRISDQSFYLTPPLGYGRLERLSCNLEKRISSRYYGTGSVIDWETR
jgi:hypothetical protein